MMPTWPDTITVEGTRRLNYALISSGLSIETLRDGGEAKILGSLENPAGRRTLSCH